MFNLISEVVTKLRMICQYERRAMLLPALPKKFQRKMITKLGLNLLDS
jgi:hypothetical protein